MSNKLKLWFDKNINDIKGCLPNGEKGRWDIYLLFNAFLGIKILDDNNLITELKNRGYDISTIKFEITKKNSEIQPVTTKDLTLDMWDKSIVNKIKRLEKSIELNNKVKKDLKKQLDHLKHQLEEKDKEIERLKVFEKAYYFNQTQVSQESMDLLLQNAYQVHNETQLAIQELVEVERLLYESHYKEIDGKYYAEYEDINNLIDSRIKALEELKGEQT